VADLAAHLGGHHRDFAETLALVRRAEALGYRAVYVDGDVSVVPSRGDAAVLDGWTATVAYLARSERIEIGGIRLPHHWNAARLAQAVATADCAAPGRLRLLTSIGAQPADRRFGLPFPPAGERIALLDEWLGALRRLLSGEVVTLHGRWVRLDGALVRPVPDRRAIEVGGARPELLRVIARRADRWDLNLPPIEETIRAATARFETLCAEEGRDPADVGRSLWLFSRPGRDPGDPSLREEFRRWNPWFRHLDDAAISRAVLAGPVGECRARVELVRSELAIDLPVLDLAGLPRNAAEEALEALVGA
jgi:alkanesulfonate monooxygenase SsuD/methylene tetrahydromethanopterin reductase-like flavin-dependent oxidoreductase (luciferase family)